VELYKDSSKGLPAHKASGAAMLHHIVCEPIDALKKAWVLLGAPRSSLLRSKLVRTRLLIVFTGLHERIPHTHVEGMTEKASRNRDALAGLCLCANGPNPHLDVVATRVRKSLKGLAESDKALRTNLRLGSFAAVFIGCMKCHLLEEHAPEDSLVAPAPAMVSMVFILKHIAFMPFNPEYVLWHEVQGPTGETIVECRAPAGQFVQGVDCLERALASHPRDAMGHGCLYFGRVGSAHRLCRSSCSGGQALLASS